ncbi:MAG: hypothetical protein GY894_06635, partial [Planctomycetes bacterium]|nr:hypothetical protein [Planctomycetota bacterium]
MMTSGRQRLPNTIAARKAVHKLVIRFALVIRLAIKSVIKQPTNRMSQGVAVEGDVEAVAVVGGMIAAPKKKFGLRTTKNCLATGGTLMESEPNGKVRLLRLLLMVGRKPQEKMDLGTGSTLIPKCKLLNQMEVLALTAVEMTIRRDHELMIDHHAVAVVAVVVGGAHEMAKLWKMRANALMKRLVKIQTKCRVGTRLVKNHSLNVNLARMKIQTENLAVVAVVVDDARQMKRRKKPVARVVQPEGLHQAVQVGNADQPAVAAAEEKPVVVVMAKVGVGKLFLVLGRGV